MTETVKPRYLSLSLSDLLREVDISHMLWEDVLQQDLVDQLGGAGLGLVLLQLLLPGVVQQVDVFVLSVKKPEIEEESDQENKM